jgi:flagellar biosynthesis component FlhA
VCCGDVFVVISLVLLGDLTVGLVMCLVLMFLNFTSVDGHSVTFIAVRCLI